MAEPSDRMPGMPTLIAMVVLTGMGLTWPGAASAQLSIAQAKEGADIVVEAATQCSDYKKDPAILARIKREWHQHLVDAGLSAGDADTLLDQSAASARAQPDTDDMALRIDCEMAGVRALKDLER